MHKPPSSEHILPQTLSVQEYIEPQIQSPSSFWILANGTKRRYATLTARAARLEECLEIDRIIALLIERAPEKLTALLRHPGLNGTAITSIMIDAPQRRITKKSHSYESPWYAELRVGLNIHDDETLVARVELTDHPARIALCIGRLLKGLQENVRTALKEAKI